MTTYIVRLFSPVWLTRQRIFRSVESMLIVVVAAPLALALYLAHLHLRRAEHVREVRTPQDAVRVLRRLSQRAPSADALICLVQRDIAHYPLTEVDMTRLSRLVQRVGRDGGSQGYAAASIWIAVVDWEIHPESHEPFSVAMYNQ